MDPDPDPNPTTNIMDPEQSWKHIQTLQNKIRVFRIRISKIKMFVSIMNLDSNTLVIDMDPEPVPVP